MKNVRTLLRFGFIFLTLLVFGDFLSPSPVHAEELLSDPSRGVLDFGISDDQPLGSSDVSPNLLFKVEYTGLHTDAKRIQFFWVRGQLGYNSRMVPEDFTLTVVPVNFIDFYKFQNSPGYEYFEINALKTEFEKNFPANTGIQDNIKIYAVGVGFETGSQQLSRDILQSFFSKNDHRALLDWFVRVSGNILGLQVSRGQKLFQDSALNIGKATIETGLNAFLTDSFLIRTTLGAQIELTAGPVATAQTQDIYAKQVDFFARIDLELFEKSENIDLYVQSGVRSSSEALRAELSKLNPYVQVGLNFKLPPFQDSPTPQFISDSCTSAQTRLTAACCGGELASNPSTLPIPDTVTVFDCTSQLPKTVNCIWQRNVPTGGEAFVEQLLSTKQFEMDASNTSTNCLMAGLDALAVCKGAFLLGDGSSCQSTAPNTSALPLCENVQSLYSSLQQTKCSITQSILQNVVQNQANQTMDSSFLDTAPETGRYFPSAIGSPVTVTPNEPPLTDGNAGAMTSMNDPQSPLRLEVPGNFLRYYISNAAIKSALNQLATTPRDGVQCSADALSCQINPLHLLNFKTILANSMSPNYSLNVSETTNGWHLNQFAGGIPGVVWATWDGSIDIDTEDTNGNIILDLKNNTNFQILPSHDPQNSNVDRSGNQYTANLSTNDSNFSYLDRAWIVSNLTGPQCSDLTHLSLSWNNGTPVFSTSFTSSSLNGNYHSFAQPYQCVCSDTATTTNVSTNFCVVDPFVRQVMIPQFEPTVMTLNGWKVRNGYCGIGNQFTADILTTQEQHTKTNTEADLRELYANYESFSPSQLDQLVNTFATFGCSGKNISRIALSTPVPFSDPLLKTATTTQRTASAVGFRFSTTIPLGGIKLVLNPAPIQVQLQIFTAIEQWAQRQSGLFSNTVNWVVQLFHVISEAILNAVANLVLVAVDTSLGPGNEAYIHFGSQTIQVDSVVSSYLDSKLLQHLEMGVKRVTATYPQTDVRLFNLQWNAPSCARITASTPLSQKVANLFGCAIESNVNLIQQVAFPIKKFIYEDLVNLSKIANRTITDKINNTLMTDVTQMEGTSKIANLMLDATKEIIYRPYFLADSVSSAEQALGLSQGTGYEKDAQVVTIETPPINQLCLLMKHSAAACKITTIVISGKPLVNYTEAYQITRLGAKTHYRSVEDLKGNAEATDFKNPNVRYCVGGDTPTGLVDYNYDQPPHLLKTLTDFGEVHQTANSGDTPTDWRTQCAMFTDLQIHTRLGFPYPAVGIQGKTLGFNFIDLIVVPTKRSNLLVNETFFCRNNQSCDYSQPSDFVRNCALTAGCDPHPLMAAYSPIQYRAELGVCSLLSDIWIRTCANSANSKECDSTNTPFLNALESGLNGIQTLASYLQKSCAVTGQDCSALNTEIKDIIGMAPICRTLLTKEGFTIQDQKNLGDIPVQFR